MKPGRRQFTLGGMMVGIAILAGGFACPEFSQGLLICAILAVGLVGFVVIPRYLVITPCFWLIGSVHRWLVSRAVPRPPGGRES